MFEGKMIKSKKGSSMVIFSVALLALVGCISISVDVGLVVNEKSRLTNATDAAVLAGAQELSRGSESAIAVASSYLEKNGVNPDDAEITVSEDGNTISVSANKVVNYYFAKALGYNTQNINSSATAKVSPITGVSSGLRPFAIERQELFFGQEYTLKDGASDGDGGNFGAVALDGNGAKIYYNNIVYGYSGNVKVGDNIDTEPGNMAGPTIIGIDLLLGMCDHCPQCTFDSFQPDCTRVITVVVVDTLDVSGRKTVQIVGFASFFLEDVSYDGGHTQITGKFVKNVINGDISDSQSDYGLKGVKLVR